MGVRLSRFSSTSSSFFCFIRRRSNKQQICVKSYICKLVNVVTKLVPNFGKLSQMNMVLIQQVHTTVIQIFNLNVSTFTITKLQVVNMFHVLFLLIWNLVRWTLFVRVHSVNFSDQITSFSVNREPVTTGLKVTT